MDVVTIRFNHLPKLQGQVRELAKLAVLKAAYDIEANAKTVVPVDTGNLKNSIQTMPESDLSATVGPRAVEYAIYVEMGTYKMRAQPYMIPAAERVRPAFIAAMEQISKI